MKTRFLTEFSHTGYCGWNYQDRGQHRKCPSVGGRREPTSKGLGVYETLNIRVPRQLRRILQFCLNFTDSHVKTGSYVQNLLTREDVFSRLPPAASAISTNKVFVYSLEEDGNERSVMTFQ